MHDEIDFLVAIANASADDDAAVWMYADWLEEQGDPRGEFVRLQLQLERGVPWDRERPQNAQRCQAILDEHSPLWTESIAEVPYVEAHFRRGVLDALTIGAADFLGAYERIVEAAPTIRRIRFTDAEALPEALASAITTAAHFNHLDFASNDLNDDWVQRFAGDIGEIDIDEIKLDANDLGRKSVAALLANPAFHRGAWGLSWNRIDQDTAVLIAEAAGSQDLALKMLFLRGNVVGDIGFAALLGAPLTSLIHLDVRYNALSHWAARRAAEGRCRLNSLDVLDLRENQLQASGAAHLATTDLAPSLTRLHLRNNGMGDAGVIAIAEASLDSLRVLEVGANQVRSDGAIAALQMSQLNYLELRDNLINDSAVDAIDAALDSTNLECLDLIGNTFTDSAANRLLALEDPRLRLEY